MDFHLPNYIDLLKKTVCRCCLQIGSCKDISAEYFEFGDKEVYEVILKKTFDIQISENFPNNITVKRLICEDCIIRLKDAYSFKKMVVNNNNKLEEYFIGLYSSENRTSTECFKIKDIIIKTELCHREDDFGNDVSENLNDDTSKSESEESNIKNLGRRKNSENNKKQNEFKDVIEEDKNNQSKSCMKTSDGRGEGPKLRENSLKLIENSTICVFQWNKSRYRCYCCTDPFNDINLLRDHTKIKHTLSDISKKIIIQQNRLVKVDISILKCCLCNEVLSNLDNLHNHLSNAHNISFSSPQHLLVPFKIQDGDLRCQICYEHFSLFRVLNIHMNKHFRRHICDVCGLSFASLFFLNLHRTRLHRTLNCVTCNLIFLTKTDKKHHDVKVHGVKYVKKERFPCQFCDKRFLSESLKVVHLIEKHDLKRPEYKCHYCSKSFITKSLLNNHKKYVHLKERVHGCDVCKSCFYTKSDLSRHKGTHVGDKKISCGSCNVMLASKYSLRRHLKRCHAE